MSHRRQLTSVPPQTFCIAPAHTFHISYLQVNAFILQLLSSQLHHHLVPTILNAHSWVYVMAMIFFFFFLWSQPFHRILSSSQLQASQVVLKKNVPHSFLNSEGEIAACRRGTGDLFNLARLTIFPISWSIMVGWNQSEYLPHITCRIRSHTLDFPHQTLHTFVFI